MSDPLSLEPGPAPDRLALVGTRSWTYRALAAEHGRRAPAPSTLGGGRALVVARADEPTVLALAALLARAVPFAVAHPKSTEEELRELVARLRPAVIFDGGWSDASAAPARAHEQVVVFTSGTSGRAKGVRLSRAALLAAARAHAEALPFADDDRWLLSLSPARIGGLSILTRTLAARRAVVLPPEGGFEPARWREAIEARRVTLLSLVPTMLTRLLAAGTPAPRSLRAVLLGGAGCPPDLLARGRAAGWPLLPTYGMSETGAQIATQRLGDPRPEGVGRPLPGAEVRLDDGGAIEVRAPTLMDGYLGERARAPGEWLRTGDLGRWLDDGSLQIVGRADDRIVSGGETIDPAEVEAALRTHPKIRDACVIGRPDDTWGEVVTAVVVSDAIGLDEIRAHVRPRLATHKHPRRLERVAALPVTPDGKIDRRALRASWDPGSRPGSPPVSEA